jgi:large subunit ribosomal protein L21
MYAVFEDGSRQYVVSEGDVIRVDFRDAELGNEVTFGRVLLYNNEEGGLQVGQPVVVGARVLAEVLDHPSEKYYIQHFRRRKNYRRFKGHRQPYTEVLIHFILLAGQEPPEEEEEQQQTPAPALDAAGPTAEDEEEGDEEEGDEEVDEGPQHQGADASKPTA